MPSEDYADRKRIAAEKQHTIRLWLEEFPDLTNSEITKRLKDSFGSIIDSASIADARKELGIVTYQSKRRKKSNGKITEDDVIVLQKQADIPADIREVLGELLTYMRGMGIVHLQLADDGKVKLKMLQELETVV